MIGQVKLGVILIKGEKHVTKFNPTSHLVADGGGYLVSLGEYRYPFPGTLGLCYGYCLAD